MSIRHGGRVHDRALAEEYAVHVINNCGSSPNLVDRSYGPVDINKVGCVEVCWWHAWLTSALRVCDTELRMFAVR